MPHSYTLLPAVKGKASTCQKQEERLTERKGRWGWSHNFDSKKQVHLVYSWSMMLSIMPSTDKRRSIRSHSLCVCVCVCV